jgi:hypothetical protein
MDNDQVREARRLRKLLARMMELANHVEQTGSFESGARDSVRRYNAIVERLEEIEAISENTFPRFDEDDESIGFGRLGAECTLLAGYLEDLLEEEDGEDVPERGRRGRHARHRRDAGIGEIVALAPFLGSEELHKLVQSHFVVKKTKDENGEEEEDEDAGKPDMKHIVALAPHMASEDLEQLVLACLSRQSNFNPKYLSALAPHLSSQALGRILREYLPNWFEEKSEKPEAKPEPKPSTEIAKTGGEGGDAWTSLTRIS